MARVYSADTDGGSARIESDLSAEAAVTSSMPAGLYAATASGNIYRAPNAATPVFSLFAAHGSELRHMALLPDGSGMLVCARASKKILSIDSGGTITDLFSTGTDDPYCIGIASGGAHDGQIFVGCYTARRLMRYDADGSNPTEILTPDDPAEAVTGVWVDSAAGLVYALARPAEIYRAALDGSGDTKLNDLDTVNNNYSSLEVDDGTGFSVCAHATNRGWVKPFNYPSFTPGPDLLEGLHVRFRAITLDTASALIYAYDGDGGHLHVCAYDGNGYSDLGAVIAGEAVTDLLLVP